MKSAKADFTGEWFAGEVRGCGLISLIRCMSRLGRMSAMHMNLWSGWHTALNRFHHPCRYYRPSANRIVLRVHKPSAGFKRLGRWSDNVHR